jgi:hypothetical protein
MIQEYKKKLGYQCANETTGVSPPFLSSTCDVRVAASFGVVDRHRKRRDVCVCRHRIDFVPREVHWLVTYTERIDIQHIWERFWRKGVESVNNKIVKNRHAQVHNRFLRVENVFRPLGKRPRQDMELVFQLCRVCDQVPVVLDLLKLIRFHDASIVGLRIGIEKREVVLVEEALVGVGAERYATREL